MVRKPLDYFLLVIVQCFYHSQDIKEIFCQNLFIANYTFVDYKIILRLIALIRIKLLEN